MLLGTMQHKPQLHDKASLLIGSNTGYSGTPLWKLKQQGALPTFNKPSDDAAALAAQEEENAQSQPLVYVDAVSVGPGGIETSQDKPLVRHIIIKDLRKVAARSKMALPASGIFEGRVPVSLFAMFDGQSCASQPGPLAAEYCAQQVHLKLLRNFSAIPPDWVNDTFVKACLTKTIEDLDKGILRDQPAVHDGCGAAVVLTVGDKLFSAVLGRCDVVLCEVTPEGANMPKSLGSLQGRCHLPEERKWLTENGGMVFDGEGGKAFVCSPSGAVASVSRSLGDRSWKGASGGVPGSVKLLRNRSESNCVQLSMQEQHPFVLMVASPIADVTSSQKLIDTVGALHMKPRAASGEVAATAAAMPANAQAQCTAVTIFFTPPVAKAEPIVKRSRKDETQNVRLRHLLVRHCDCGQPWDPVRSKQVSRSKSEAEALLRRALIEIALEANAKKAARGVKDPKANLQALQPTTKYLALCKEMSECTTAQKGGGQCGDLGWMSESQLKTMGTSFTETARALQIGQWSDLVASEDGVHILHRIA